MARRTTSRPTAARGLWRHSRTDSFTVVSEPVIPPLRVWIGALLRARAEATALVVAVIALSLLHRLLPWGAVVAVVVLVGVVVIGGVLGGVLLAEIVFTYPGLGYVLFNALQTHDFPVMQTIFLMITLTVLVANFLADSLYVLLDPRTREAG